MGREYTSELVEMAEQTVIDWETIARECLARMSEDEVQEMCEECDWIEPEEDEEEEEDEDGWDGEGDDEEEEEIPDGEAGAYVDRIENPEQGTIGW